MTICYVYQDQYPWDIRVEKITAALAEGGMDVHIVSRNRSGAPLAERLAPRLSVHRVARGFGRLSRAIFNFPAFFSPTWIRKTMAVVREARADVIIVRDLPLGPMAYLAGRLTGTPVVMDMAENYPAMLQDYWTFQNPRPLDYLIRNPMFLRRLERWLLPRLDGVLVVSEWSAARVRALAASTPVVVVGNTPSIATRADGATHALIDQLHARPGLTLLYVGGMEETRGLETVIAALPEVIETIAGFRFVIVGRGSSEARLRQLARDIGVDHHVVFAGWLDHALVPAVVAASDLCIVPHFVTEHTDSTIPNKIFDYMLQKRPVIVTAAKSLTHIVESCQCGRVYPDKDPAALAQAILGLSDADTRRTLGESGFRAIQERYNWERDKATLLGAVRSLAGRSALGAELDSPESRLQPRRSVQ